MNTAIEKMPSPALVEKPSLNCTPFVRQYDILSNKWGVLLCQKSTKQTIYAGIQKLLVETMQEEKLSYSETCHGFEVNR